MTDETPRTISGTYVKGLRRAEKETAGLRLCPSCGAKLSRWNDGSLCNQCHDTTGVARPLRIRGRSVRPNDSKE